VPGTFSYTPAVGTVLAAGTQTLTVTFTPDDANYASATARVLLTVDRATLTVTADDTSRSYGVADPAFSASFRGFVNGETLATSGVTGSPSLTSPATAGSAPGAYAITSGAGSLAGANYDFTFVNGTLTVTPAPLAATGVNVSATAGAPFRSAVATFANADPFGTAASYTAVIAWGDGTQSLGTINDSGGGTFTVTGAHTYAAPGSPPLSVTIRHSLGYTTTVTTQSTATVAPLRAMPVVTADPRTPFVLSLRAFAGGTPLSWVIHWGDGQVQHLAGSARRVSHQYALRTQRHVIVAIATYADGTWAVHALRSRLSFRDPLAGFVADRFYALTGVAINAARLRQWTRLLHQATGPAALRTARSLVVGLIRMSVEYHRRLVRRLYQQVLHRNPTRQELRRALSLFSRVPLLASDLADGGWASVEPLLLEEITSGR
jgi:MBG domain (YGX type)